MKIKVPASLDKFFAIDANKVAMVKIKMISVLKLPFRVSKILFISEKLKQRLKEKYVAVNLSLIHIFLGSKNDGMTRSNNASSMDNEFGVPMDGFSEMDDDDMPF